MGSSGPRRQSPRHKAQKKGAARLALVAVAALVPTLVSISPASADSTNGILFLGGPGGGFSFDSLAARTGAPGSTVSFAVRIFNRDNAQAQFRFRVGPNDSGLKTQVLSGAGVDVTALATGSDGYYTAPLAPQKYEALTVKVVIPTGTPSSGISDTGIELDSSGGTWISAADLYTSITPPKGYLPSSSDLSVTAKASNSATASNQPAIGSPWTELVSAPNVSENGGSTTFTATLANHSSATVTDDLSLQRGFSENGFPYRSACTSNATATMQANVLDTASQYKEVVLGPGKSVTYTVTVKVPGSYQGCWGQYFTLTPRDITNPSAPVDGAYQYLGVSETYFN